MASADVLVEMFRTSHNSPSTPVRSLTGEVRERTIWGYWAQGYDEMPEFFKLCVETWRRHNPNWDVRIVQKSTVHEYLSAAELPNRFMQMLSHQTASDCVRLALLSRYGGIYMDVSILLRSGLDQLCWDAIASGRRAATVFFHPYYGTQALGGEDLTESWFLATLPGNPFFIRWRDLFRELLHNRLDIDGLLQHPLYHHIDLSGIDRLNKQFVGLTFDFREYLAIHAMCHRLLETDKRAHAQWRDDFHRIDAAKTAFRIQLDAEARGQSAAEAFLRRGVGNSVDHSADDVPLVKFTTPHYGPLLQFSRAQLLDNSHVLGRLMTQQATGAARVAAAAHGRRGCARVAGVGILRVASCTGLLFASAWKRLL